MLSSGGKILQSFDKITWPLKQPSTKPLCSVQVGQKNLQSFDKITWPFKQPSTKTLCSVLVGEKSSKF